MQAPEQHPLYPWLVETRRDFHRHPEVGHREAGRC
jgi:metal-dependent amidase/aminoacylase/carboxypeptidase family protein